MGDTSITVGITGGVGSGKTAFTRELKKMGAAVIDADEVARNLVDHSPDIREALRLAFGTDIFDASGALRRRILGRIVFSDPARLKILNDILRSPMIREIKKKIAEYRIAQKDMIVVDMAILFEAGLESLFDIIVVVSAPEEKRIRWLEDDRGWSREEIRDRMEAQMDVRHKEQKAHIIIQNADSLNVFRQKARNFYRQHIQSS